ncbi:MAG: LemA family protein [Bacteroidota bacterium]|nr:LemA family protein [Bacteroidota bacterium]
MKKSWIIIIILVVVGLIFFSSIRGTYNNLVDMEESISEKWSQVENVYQRRADLIPNLVNTVKGYAEHEQQTFTQVTEARSRATSVNIDPSNLNANSLQQFQQAQEGLSQALSRLLLVVERYPELKANQNFLELQAQLEGTENRITVERQKFNQAVKEYNAYVRKFPQTIWASIFGFERKAYFEAQEGAEKAPEVNF